MGLCDIRQGGDGLTSSHIANEDATSVKLSYCFTLVIMQMKAQLRFLALGQLFLCCLVNMGLKSDLPMTCTWQCLQR